ncbi:10036_t:CDS:2 [Diversispora eburnea]|uniref:10036_t:CDS:1 n=1 Tax=Diversispora eburnea TaxID=1213867 RepID=A0A9N8ZF56_9GLOM|nr:10036_t:CDS:2 [Diversispora eburnea]
MAYGAVPESMRNVKAFLYDVFGTIVDLRTTITQELTSFATLTSTRCSINSQLSSKNWSEFSQKWRLLSTKRIQQSLLGLEPFRTIDEINREILFSLIQEFDLPQYVWSDDEMDQLNLVWHRLDCYDDCIKGLSKLSKKYLNATLSNANVRLLVDLKRHNGLHMLDYMFSAELFKEFIPKKSTYLGACKMLNLDPSEVVMVSSHYSDLLNSKELVEFDWVVDNLEELAEIMGC